MYEQSCALCKIYHWWNAAKLRRRSRHAMTRPRIVTGSAKIETLNGFQGTAGSRRGTAARRLRLRFKGGTQTFN